MKGMWVVRMAGFLAGVTLAGCATSNPQAARDVKADEALTTQPASPLVPEEVALPEPQPGLDQEPPRSQSPNP